MIGLAWLCHPSIIVIPSFSTATCVLPLIFLCVSRAAGDADAHSRGLLQYPFHTHSRAEPSQQPKTQQATTTAALAHPRHRVFARLRHPLRSLLFWCFGVFSFFGASFLFGAAFAFWCVLLCPSSLPLLLCSPAVSSSSSVLYFPRFHTLHSLALAAQREFT